MIDFRAWEVDMVDQSPSVASCLTKFTRSPLLSQLTHGGSRGSRLNVHPATEHAECDCHYGADDDASDEYERSGEAEQAQRQHGDRKQRHPSPVALHERSMLLSDELAGVRTRSPVTREISVASTLIQRLSSYRLGKLARTWADV